MRIRPPLLFFAALFWVSLAHAAKTPLAVSSSKPIPDFTFTNQDGKTFHLYDFKGQFVFVSFIYTRCPMKSMCPLTTLLTVNVARQWEKLKRKPPFHVLIITLDPKFDTPARLKNYAHKYSTNLNRITFATGSPQTLADFESYFDVLAIPEGGLVNHNVESVLLSPAMKNLKEFYENRWAPKDVLKLLDNVK